MFQNNNDKYNFDLSRQRNALFDWIEECRESRPGIKVWSVSVVVAIWRSNKPIVSDNKFFSISAVVVSSSQQYTREIKPVDPNCMYTYIYLWTASVWLLTTQLQDLFFIKRSDIFLLKQLGLNPMTCFWYGLDIKLLIWIKIF